MGRGLRTELTVQNPYDFGVRRTLENLSALRERGFQTTRRVIDVQKTSQDFAMSEKLFREVISPKTVAGQRASALKFGDPVVFALLSVLVLFRVLPCGFRSRDSARACCLAFGREPQRLAQTQNSTKPSHASTKPSNNTLKTPTSRQPLDPNRTTFAL